MGYHCLRHENAGAGGTATIDVARGTSPANINMSMVESRQHRITTSNINQLELKSLNAVIISSALRAEDVLGNFSTLPDSAKWIMSFAMLLGRLEIFTVLVMLNPAFWQR